MEQTIAASSSRPAATTQAPPAAGLVPPGIIRKLEREASKHWDKFYKVHEDRFFHDRHWTQREFGALDEAAGGSSKDEAQSQDQPVIDVAALQESTSDRDPVLLEVGCGVGNMVWPLLESVPKLKVACCDFSVRAVDILKQHPLYDPERVHAFVYDLISASETPASASTPDLTRFGAPTLVSLIFVLSAIPPKHHVEVLRRLFALLAPGGSLLFRDYAEGDLAQRRFQGSDGDAGEGGGAANSGSKRKPWFEPNRLSSDHHFYKRGDGTMTFFFGEEYVRELTRQAFGDDELQQGFKINVVHRDGVNRKTQMALNRRFIQASWTKKA